ncbi:MBL fold metallo-hydrolase [Saccharothrix variisporea]|uniref:Cyclase n=1 Tax=Saccharothrix variisporea TaxID=543527 RepID=A0A495XSP4_9PSEU|nr:MBL fold metallo-hydrolase [Saccharothrix variisporea]RKT74688.1 cyclase [Saccharothrix variisporea]
MARADERVLSEELTEVAEGVHAYVQHDGSWCLSNAGVIVDGDDVVVVDTAATERRARRLRAAIASVTGATPRAVVNTHFHGDHTFGNFVFRPEAAIIAHEGAREEAAAADLGMRGLWPDVDWGGVALALPTTTYRDRMTLHVGGLAVELRHPGPAHTTSDTVVWVPDRSVLFTGDIVMSGATPFCLMGSVSGSLRTIEWLRSFDARVVVTGHGPVGGPELFDVAESYLRWVQRLAADGVRRGLSPSAVAREADLGAFAHLLDPERLVGNLHRAYAEQHGRPEGVPLDVLGIFHEMVDHHGGPLTCFA